MSPRQTHDLTLETHIEGRGSRRTTVRASASVQRPWMGTAAECAAMKRHRILHIGVADMASPYQIVRQQQNGAYFLACLGGEGRVLVDGKWRKVTAGTACLLPPRILNAFHTAQGKRWQFCWVRYETTTGKQPMFPASAPVLSAFDAAPLRSAIIGLHDACQGPEIPSASAQWLALVQTYVHHFASAWQYDERLARVWNLVSLEPARSWTSTTLSQEARMSFEHLRRLSLKLLGRTPMNQVTHLRMQHAAHLLTTTDLKLEVIAHEIGFASGKAFAATFKRWIGWSPSEFRSHPTKRTR